METSEQPSPAKRKRPGPPLPTAPGSLPITLGSLQGPVPDNTHAPCSPVVLDALPDGIVVDGTMKNHVRWNEVLRDGLRVKYQEAADVHERPRTLAAFAPNISTPIRRSHTNGDKQALRTITQQEESLKQQEGWAKTTPGAHIQGADTADESPVMQLLREVQQQIQDIQQQQNDMQATLQHQTQQQQSFQAKMLKRQELEHMQAARARDRERFRDLTAMGIAIEKAFGERASGLQERSQKITMREKELQEELGSQRMMWQW
ncbi:hypothetical protein MBLNU13_g09309t1 [Cladosporium sp. NU13]